MKKTKEVKAGPLSQETLGALSHLEAALYSTLLADVQYKAVCLFNLLRSNGYELRPIPKKRKRK